MAYVRSKRNIRRPRRVRRSVRRRASARRTYTRSRTRKAPCVCPAELTPSAKFALAQIDPFEPLCLGAKVPDSNTIPSIANADTDQIGINPIVTAGHLCAMAFAPSYVNATNLASPGTSVSWNQAWASRRNFTNVVSSIEGIRPVAHAIRISSPLAPTAATGFVHIGLDVESRRAHTTGGTAIPEFPTTVNEMTGLAHYKRFTVASLTQSPVTAINKWIDETGFRYDDPRSFNNYISEASNTLVNTTFNFGGSWANIIVMVEGAPTGQNVLSFEHLLLTECIPRKDAFILGTQAAPNSPGTMSAVSQMAASGDFAHTEAGQESYINKSLAALADGAKTAGAQVYDNVAVPLMQRAGNMAVNYATSYALGALAGVAGISGVNSNPGRLALTR